MQGGRYIETREHVVIFYERGQNRRLLCVVSLWWVATCSFSYLCGTSAVSADHGLPSPSLINTSHPLFPSQPDAPSASPTCTAHVLRRPPSRSHLCSFSGHACPLELNPLFNAPQTPSTDAAAIAPDSIISNPRVPCQEVPVQ